MMKDVIKLEIYLKNLFGGIKVEVILHPLKTSPPDHLSQIILRK